MGWGVDIWFAMAAVVGGIVRLITGLLNGGSLGWLMALGHIVVSAFAGWTCGTFVLAVAPDLAMPTAAVSGYLGTQALDFVSEAIKKKLNA